VIPSASEFYSGAAIAYLGDGDSRPGRSQKLSGDEVEVVPFLEAITVLGDPGFILAASGGLFATLIAVGDRRSAFALAIALAASASVTAMAKIGFMAFGPPSVYSPSGHAAMATAFLLSVGAIVARSRGLAGALCAGSALAVAASRVVLGAHSLAEAVIGVAIGLCAFAVFARLATRRSRIGQGPIAAGFATALCLHVAIGARFSVEEPLERAASALRGMAR
jgi:membrane-associated phospholipid phosphatase